MNQPSLSLPSFAKINWSLRILGRRPDGYHEIRTVLQTVSLHDDIHFELSDDGVIALSCDEPDIPIDDQNLIVRAATVLKSRYNVQEGVKIRLEKRIPAKAGLGGGSSNAAVTLLALAHLWKINAPATILVEMGAALGADVPFFLVGGCAIATGTGATVSASPASADDTVRHLVVITPNASVSTAKAYAAVSSAALTQSSSESILSSSRDEAKARDSQLWRLEDSLENTFESVIFDIEPEIRRTKETLLQAGARGALLAGSGSSVFGIFTNREDQQRAVNEIKLEAGWRIFPCVTVSRNEYMRALGSWDTSFLRSFNSGSDIGA
ncbi:MAG TPA: 4-(cytidine 5'-diphospho)-2-C-methyl-D-erythritol kinase [Pyrinomonadaceae bacterium]|nr:4-(cytidine 5'-diphospho)-2-C-methyl-D-erythritol kinase [Pyrinomonadaceae bacterium]